MFVHRTYEGARHIGSDGAEVPTGTKSATCVSVQLVMTRTAGPAAFDGRGLLGVQGGLLGRPRWLKAARRGTGTGRAAPRGARAPAVTDTRFKACAINSL